jgi:serine/threonine protein kinase
MEYLHGKTFKALTEREPLSAQRAAMLMVQVLAGLEAVHRKDIVHRDLKPDNLMLVKDEEGKELVKILDFGISKRLGDPRISGEDGGGGRPVQLEARARGQMKAQLAQKKVKAQPTNVEADNGEDREQKQRDQQRPRLHQRRQRGTVGDPQKRGHQPDGGRHADDQYQETAFDHVIESFCPRRHRKRPCSPST